MNLKQSVGKEKSTGDIQNLEVVPLAIQWHHCFHSGTWSLGNPGNLADKFAQKSLESTLFRGYVSFRAGNPWKWSKQKQHGKHPALPIFTLDVCLRWPSPRAPPAYPKMKVLGTLDALSGSRWSFISPWKMPDPNGKCSVNSTITLATTKLETIKLENWWCNLIKTIGVFLFLSASHVFPMNGFRPCSDCWGHHLRISLWICTICTYQ